MLNRLPYVFLSVFVLQSCEWFKKPTPVEPIEEQIPTFNTTPLVFPLKRGIVDEASGIADSRNLPGNIWVHEDGDNPAAIYLFTHQGELQSTISLPITNRDWEDIAIGPGPETDKNYLYIGEIGDNATVHDEYAIYRFLEPAALNETPTQIDKLRFVYEDGKKYNAETLLIDPDTKDLYVITKGVFTERIFRLAFPQSVNNINTAEFVGNTQQFILTGGEISADGTQILLKNYETVIYWKRRKDESIVQAISRLRDLNAPYIREVQGEAICFSVDGNGYFTLSERANSTAEIPLYFYSKQP